MQFVTQLPQLVRGDLYLSRSCLPVLPRILPWPIDVKGVMGVLYGRDRNAARDEFRDQRRHQCRLAASAPAGETEDSHLFHPCGLAWGVSRAVAMNSSTLDARTCGCRLWALAAAGACGEAPLADSR